jgi:chorismate mutase
LLRGIRGAVQSRANTPEDIHAATQELLLALIEANGVRTPDIASVFLTSTPDLDADFPAYAVRQLAGWSQVPLLGAQELGVSGALPRVIRVLLHVNTAASAADIRHVYLGETKKLRPDIA